MDDTILVHWWSKLRITFASPCSQAVSHNVTTTAAQAPLFSCQSAELLQTFQEEGC